MITLKLSDAYQNDTQITLRARILDFEMNCLFKICSIVNNARTALFATMYKKKLTLYSTIFLLLFIYPVQLFNTSEFVSEMN